MNRRDLFLLVSLLVLGLDSALLATRDSRSWEIFPEIVKIELFYLEIQEKVPESLQHLKAQVLDTGEAGPEFKLEESRGLSSEARNRLGDLARHSALAVTSGLLPAVDVSPWRTEYSERVEVIALALSKREGARKFEMRLRLWVAEDASTAARLFWLRSGGSSWRPPGHEESSGNDSSSHEGFELKFRRHGGSRHSVFLKEGDPKLAPDLLGVLEGNVLVEIEGNTYFKLPDKEGWFSSGLAEQDLAWQIIERMQGSLKGLKGEPLR